MPPLDEGTILFMPTTVPGPSVARIREVLRIPDEILAAFPEVETVWGTAGRAETATDPAGLDASDRAADRRAIAQPDPRRPS